MCHYSKSQRSQQKYLWSNKELSELSGRTGNQNLHCFYLKQKPQNEEPMISEQQKLHSKSWRSQSQHLSVVMLQYKINLSYLQEFTLSWCLEACYFFSSTRNTQQVTGKLLWVTSPAVPRYPLCCFITSRT